MKLLGSVVACGVVLCSVAALLFALAQPSPFQLRHLSPDGRFAALLTSDTSFGQVEHLRVLLDPGKPEARLIFEAVGDVPLHFLGWRDGATAELEEPPHDGGQLCRLLLHCAPKTCRLDRAPQP